MHFSWSEEMIRSKAEGGQPTSVKSRGSTFSIRAKADGKQPTERLISSIRNHLDPQSREDGQYTRPKCPSDTSKLMDNNQQKDPYRRAEII